MAEVDFDKDNELALEYVRRFGPLPDFRSMHPDNLATVMDRIEEALERDRALTEEEWGVPTDIPPEVTI